MRGATCWAAVSFLVVWFVTGVNGWKFGARLGSPQIIQWSTAAYFFEMAVVKSPKSVKLSGTNCQLLPPLAHGGVPRIRIWTCMPAAVAWSIASVRYCGQV